MPVEVKRTMGYVICYPSEIILANLANLSMCHLTFSGTSTACTWGIRGIFFSDTIFCALLPLVLLCCFVVVILPTTVATLILRIFWNNQMTVCILATSAQTICHHTIRRPIYLYHSTIVYDFIYLISLEPIPPLPPLNSHVRHG